MYCPRRRIRRRRSAQVRDAKLAKTIVDRLNEDGAQTELSAVQHKEL